MERTFAELPVNPFEDNIVYEPREAEPAIEGLNDRPWQRLMEEFERLEAEPVPRRQPVRLKAQLVTSAEPGYGKSHLIGRLFHSLAGRATPVYLRPFQDPGSAWRSILLKLVQELQRPDAALASVGRSGVSQLDTFAAGVFAGLFLALIEHGVLDDDPPAGWSGGLRDDPLGVFGFGNGRRGEDSPDSLTEWLRAQLAGGGLLAAMEAEIVEAGIVLHAPARVWLRALFTIGSASRYAAERAAVLDWFKGEELADAAAITALGLCPEDAVGETPGRRNEEAWRRLQDFFALAGYYRPFLLCFDQTESLSGDPALAAKFGEVIECLVSHGLNQMTVVTANLDPWRATILPRMQTALHARFSAPLDLRGINAGQAGALARRRLEDAGMAADEVARFCNPAWLEDVFREKPEESVRRFLDGCALRCQTLRERPPLPPARLEDWFARQLAEVEAKPQALVFDLEVLPWAVGPEAVNATLDDVSVERLIDPSGDYRVSWRSPGRRVLFGFEDSSNWERWKAIVAQAGALAGRHGHDGTALRCVFLRTPEQKPLPKQSWKVTGAEMQEAEAAGWFAVRVIERDRLAVLHAASSLYHDAVGGDTPFTPEETLAFLRVKLVGWWRGWLSPAG